MRPLRSLSIRLRYVDDFMLLGNPHADDVLGAFYLTHHVTAALHAVSYPAAAVLAVLAGMAVLVAARPRRRTARAAALHGDGAATASATDSLWAFMEESLLRSVFGLLIEC
ncbi:hypothetical protein PLESTB_000338500 [Pleodorina starrii]|uniref:Uncharacterized protein n=1 Tax=Pleodorina starrii TaxID=330485 RepID=A0A9W6BDC4_9CHLO|nr:hypothetical protein PLESTB_000338500 [Pleodorina starrii]GLC73153.1 hypothetical protein PLESTF_001337800 [Pleodorina starrii]